MPTFRQLFRPVLMTVLLGVVTGSLAHAQRRMDDRDWLESCRERGGRNRVSVCQEREMTIPARSGRLVVDAEPNGGITVVGSSRRDIRLVARIQATARREADAEAMVEEIEIETEREVHATGPRMGRDESWSVSFVLEVPSSIDLDLGSTNGGISVEGVEGDLDLSTTNGGLSLAAVAGSVRGRTTNGGVNITLDGSQWRGSGLDIETTNGGVELEVPERYNARLETGTVNGGMRFDFPVTVQGRISRRLTTDLGSGGPPIRVVTTNGGVTVSRR
jgi:hypothetical protein